MLPERPPPRDAAEARYAAPRQRVSPAWRRKAAQKRPHRPSRRRQSARPAQPASAFSVPKIAMTDRFCTHLERQSRAVVSYLAPNRSTKSPVAGLWTLSVKKNPNLAARVFYDPLVGDGRNGLMY